MAQREQRPPRFEDRACALCGEPFRASNPGAKYCSPAVRARATEARQAGRRAGTGRGGPSRVDISPPKEEG